MTTQPEINLEALQAHQEGFALGLRQHMHGVNATDDE